MTDDREDTTIYQVVVNDQEQYSIWPADRELPLGWKAEGFSGQKEACMAHIHDVWTDMRPKSLRDAMDQAAARDGG
ncbi:MAG TPA: MbtH family NRPS accessory protein [Allosphingosinicella sp.]|jgi:MbtH protein